MAHIVEVTGVKEIRAKLRATGVTLGENVARGLKRAGLFLQRESMKIVPIQWGNLRDSAGTRALGAGWRTDVVVFYEAGYATFVHENTAAVHGEAFNIKYADRIAEAQSSTKKGEKKSIWFRRGKGQQAKFLETPAREKRSEILAIIAGEVKGPSLKGGGISKGGGGRRQWRNQYGSGIVGGKG